MSNPTPPPIYDADELRAKAEAATPGPWVDDGNGIGKAHHREPWHEQVVGLETVGSPYMEHETLVLREADREFIAAANPAVVLALLDELKATRAQLADERNKTREAEEDAFFKKDWR